MSLERQVSFYRDQVYCFRIERVSHNHELYRLGWDNVCTLYIPLDERACILMPCRIGPEDRQMVALWVRAGKIHFLSGITVDADLATPAVGLCDFNGTGIVICTHVVGCCFSLGNEHSK